MNREIKFRGKDDKGNWVYGYPIIVLYRAWIQDINDTTTNPRRLAQDFADFRCVEVEKETIGQYIGVKDKNGVEIYEGDIVKCVDEYTTIGAVEYATNIGTYIVRYTRDGDYYYSPLNRGDISRGLQLQETEVIGNIYENKELLNE